MCLVRLTRMEILILKLVSSLVVEVQRKPIKKAEVLLRPQNITLYRDASGEAIVKELQFMGDTCRYVIDSDGVELIAVSNDSLTIGEKVKFEIKPHCPIVFVQENK